MMSYLYGNGLGIFLQPWASTWIIKHSKTHRNIRNVKHMFRMNKMIKFL